MTDQAILDRLSHILGILLKSDSIVLTPQTTRPDVPGWDSFTFINFVVAVEEEFGIKFHVADIEAFQTVDDIVQGIKILKDWQ